jgi:hypothetical protein
LVRKPDKTRKTKNQTKNFKTRDTLKRPDCSFLVFNKTIWQPCATSQTREFYVLKLLSSEEKDPKTNAIYQMLIQLKV